MGISKGVMTHASYLPGNLHSWLATGYLEAVVCYRLSYVNQGRLAYAGKLIAEVLVERLEIVWHIHPGFTVCI